MRKYRGLALRWKEIEGLAEPQRSQLFIDPYVSRGAEETKVGASGESSAARARRPEQGRHF